MEEVYGLYAEGPDIPGDTATANVRRALMGAGVPEPEIEGGLPRWCTTFSGCYVRLLGDADTSHWVLAPHAASAIGAVEQPVLLTGNPPAVAHARMERLGIGHLFPLGQGAFGCERANRIELFDLARSRGHDWPAARTVAVGDTPLDISSAHAADCRCVGVTTGAFGAAELADADAVIADLGELASALAALAA